MDAVLDPGAAAPSSDLAGVDRAAAEVVVLLGASNLVANRVLAERWYIPWNLSMAAAVVGLSRRRGGCSTADLGLGREAVPRGVRMGVAAAAGIGVGVAAAAGLPVTSAFFADERGDVTGGQLAWKVLVSIPLGTAVLEEVAFRGALPALLERHPWWTHRRAVTASAALFGLWHVLPSLRLEEQNAGLSARGELDALRIVAGSVVVTGLTGRGLSWLRDRSGSLAAPILAHVAVNAAGSLAAWARGR